jgi:hypothetical protein
VPAPFGFLCKKSNVSLTDVVAAFVPAPLLQRGSRPQSRVLRSRRSAAGELLMWFALGGGPPDFWKVPDPYEVSGRGPCRAGLPPGTVAVVYPAVSVLSPLSMMICSTSLAVYLLRTSAVNGHRPFVVGLRPSPLEGSTAQL